MPTPRVYYNEFDVKAAAWLRELIKAGHIAPGDVDDRSIADVAAVDLKGYTQCHFFAGIGGWSYALRLAGWPDDRPVWTGSCPCQPFSAAGKRGGTDDARHLWPEFYRLISFCRPSTIFGEQVASKDGLAWLDIVSTDLERADYAVGAADMCAAGVGAPHIRQRLYFVAYADGRDASTEREQRSGQYRLVAQNGFARTVEHATSERRQQRRPESGERGVECGRGQSDQSTPQTSAWGACDFIPCTGDVGDTDEPGSQGRRERRHSANQRSPWAADLVDCRDGKRRPIEPGSFPLAHGIPHRVGLLRGYGNAIVPQVAAKFIGAYLDIAG